MLLFASVLLLFFLCLLFNAALLVVFFQRRCLAPSFATKSSLLVFWKRTSSDGNILFICVLQDL